MTRIGLLALAAVLLTFPPSRVARAEEPIELTWEQLIPQEVRTVADPAPWGEVMHGQLDASPGPGAAATGVVTEYDNKQVRIAGFMVPLDLEAEGIKEFLLVPYYGACIHVPPPPPHQIVYVESAAVEIDNPFDAVWVTGTLAATGLSTELADVGYRLAAQNVEPMQSERWTGGMSGYLNNSK